MPEKILVVDDDPDILDALTMILESQGYQVVTARDGIEGLANLKAEKPDLMILDLLMPKMDGWAVCKELQDPRWSKYKGYTYPNFNLGERGSQPPSLRAGNWPGA